MNKVEKAICIMLAIILVFAIGWMVGYKCQPTQYANVAEVLAVDHDRDLVVCRDPVGHVWSFIGAEDWEPGDCAALVMDDQGTELVIDDLVISARYCACGLRWVP